MKKNDYLGYDRERLIFEAAGVPVREFIIWGLICLAFPTVFWGIIFLAVETQRIIEVFSTTVVVLGIAVPGGIGLISTLYGLIAFKRNSKIQVTITEDEFICFSGGKYYHMNHSEVKGIKFGDRPPKYRGATQPDFGKVVIITGEKVFKLKILRAARMNEIIKKDFNGLIKY
jgi:hypothetical protein